MRDESDGGESEYKRISCAQCSSTVGRSYVRTGPNNARLQDLLTLDINAVKSYQLGVHGFKVTGFEDGDGDGDGDGDADSAAHKLRTTRLEEQMIKVENVMVIFAERMGAMESALKAVQSRLDSVTDTSEPVTWGMGGGGGGGGVTMPMLPGEHQQSPHQRQQHPHQQQYDGGDGGGGGGGGGGYPHQGSGGGGHRPFRGAAAGAVMYGGGGSARGHPSHSPFGGVR